MATTTVWFGGSLVLVGVVSFLISFFSLKEVAPTALIPAGIGLVLIVLGVLSFKDSLRKHTMHAAALVGSLTFFLCFVMAAPLWPVLLTQGQVLKTTAGGVRDATLAVLSQTLTALIALVFVLLCVRSFMEARRSRARAAAAEAAKGPA